MRVGKRIPRCLLGLAIAGLAASTALGDEPQGIGRLGRLFRLGSASGTSRPAPSAEATPPIDQPGTVAFSTPPATTPTPVTTPGAGSSGPSAKISPQPRVSRAATEADPIVSRVGIGRSDGGGQFAMLLEVFADGTVIDTEGVHHVGHDLIRPIVDVLHQGDVFRQKGHCGTPSTDFVEYSHVVVYERAFGKLRAAAFSYSGNQHGCDPSVRKLHAALDAIQNRLSQPATPAAAATPAAPPATAPPAPAAPVLGLTAPG